MLTVDEHDLIRRKHVVDGMSLRAISRELAYDRTTEDVHLIVEI